jgi:hypothetical protein
VGAKVKGYRAVGGWNIQAVEGINKYGICTSELWPDIAVSKQYDTEASQGNAKLHSLPEFWELPKKNFDVLMSVLLQGMPVGTGLLWWGHAVINCDPIVKDGKYGVRIRNSWGSNWGDNGFGILMEGKATPDEAVGIRTTSATNE